MVLPVLFRVKQIKILPLGSMFLKCIQSSFYMYVKRGLKLWLDEIYPYGSGAMVATKHMLY